jgi:hypothetical protein
VAEGLGAAPLVLELLEATQYLAPLLAQAVAAAPLMVAQH